MEKDKHLGLRIELILSTLYFFEWRENLCMVKKEVNIIPFSE